MEHKLTVLLLVVASLVAFQVEAKTIVPQGRIIGGHFAEEGTVPYQVSLQTKWGHFCGGSIVGLKWVVTAAHCFNNKYADDIIIYAGIQDLSKSDEVITYYVERIYIHCNYNVPRAGNDIALLLLTETIELNDRVQIIPLATKPLRNGDMVTLTGWGIEEQYGDYVDRLKTLDLNFVPHEECREIHIKAESEEVVDVGHICTFTRRGEGSCHHDSGSPLVSDGFLVAVVNWGTECALGNPDVHASIYYYLNWLRLIMTSDENCDCNVFVKGRRPVNE